MDFLSYYLNRLWEVAPLPVGLALLAAVSLTRISQIPRWVRVELSAVYLPLTLVWGALLGVNFAPVYLAHNIVAGVLVLFGMGFSLFRFHHPYCQVSSVIFGLCFLLVGIAVAFNLHRHYLIHIGH